MINIQEKLLDYQLQKTSDTLTSKSGLSIFYEAALALDVVENIKQNLPEPKSNRGLRPAEYIMPLALMFCGGGRAMEDIREIEIDKGLRKICGLAKVPGADAIGKWLRKTDNLAGLKTTNKQLAAEIIRRGGKDNFILDTDATLIETEKECAEMNYKGFTAFSVLLSFLADLDLCVAADYRNGAAHAGAGTKEQLEYADDLLKSLGKKLRYFRSDSAGYSADVFNACFERGIIFTVTADQDAAVKAAIKTIKAEDWRPLYYDEKGENAGRQFAAIVHCMEKTKEPFTLIVQRWQEPQQKLFEKNPCHYYVIATNDFERENSAAEIIFHHNRRGNAENYNKEIKSGFGMDYAPSRELAANAVYFEIGVLAYNLTIAVKRLFLAEGWATKTIATLRWQLIFVAGKVIEHGRQLFLKIEDAYFELLKNVRQKIRLAIVPTG